MKSCSGDEGWWQFIKLCRQLKTEKQLNDFFDLFLTIEERKAIGNRYSIIKELLTEEKTQREIAKQFKTSIAKITRGSNYLKTISNDLRKFLEKHLL